MSTGQNFVIVTFTNHGRSSRIILVQISNELIFSHVLGDLLHAGLMFIGTPTYVTRDQIT